MLRDLVWPRADRLLVEQLRLVYGNIGISVIPAFLLALLLVFTLQNDANRTALLLWCGAVMLTKSYSAVDARRRLRQQIEPARARRLLLQQVVIHTLDGAAWGALALVALDSSTISGRVLIFAVLTGILGSAMSLLAPVWIVFVAFALALVAGATAWLWFSGDRFYQALSIAGVLYIASLVGQARNSAIAALAAIKLRFDNIDLVRQAEAARSAAEQANLAKSKFLAAASHDLRQPIHAQGLFLDVLSRTGLNAHQQEVLDSARSAWLASSDMLNTLLDFSRIEAGVVRPNPHPFRLQPLLYKIENDLAPLADAKGLLYRTRETELTVHSDPALLELVLRNLVSNAIRYSEVGGVLVACRRRGATVLLEVWDTGIGIAAADRAEIFREFHQLGNAERDRSQGLGLGLSIVDGLARALGHPLSLASTPGRGSVFRITVPLADPAAADIGPAPLTPRLTKQRVLIIDDDAAVRSGMAQLLRSWGCECDAAETVDEALELAARVTPELIISDYRLKGSRTGADAIAALRERLGIMVPALIITGDTAPERLREATASGIALLHKPLTPDQLQRALVELVRTPELVTASAADAATVSAPV
jgi:signal transduction histidine kinase/CheY-like chemotaxis protein